MRSLSALLALLLCAPAPCLAEGKLDLPLVTPVLLPAEKAAKDIPPITQELWAPGNPNSLRGAGPFERGVGFAGNAGMGAFGAAASARNFGRSREATAATLGFSALGALNLWMWKKSNAPESRR
jgi:hypothetical protein